MNTENKITPFLFGESTIRTTNIDGATWFVTKDVCQVLGLENHNQAIASLDEDEKGVTNNDPLSRGGKQIIGIVSEPGLYRLIFKSRKAEAKSFQRWVYHEVLPNIRRTGSYNVNHNAYLYLIEDQIKLGVSPDLAAKGAQRLAPLPRAQRMARPATVVSDAVQEILDVMQPEIAYTIPELLALLPQKHRLRSGSMPSQLSSVGKLLTNAHAHPC